MEGFGTFLAALLVLVAGLNTLASRIGIPYPIVLVAGGLVVGLVPGMPRVELDPELVLLVFLPPLLYAAAFFSDLRALRSDARALSLTSIGLVLATMAAVGALGHEVLDLPWPMALALGAIVSPTDPVAATAIMRRLGTSRRIVNLVEGESLVNDAAALVGYRVALGAAVAGSFSLIEATFGFVLAAAGGVAIGLAVGWVIGEIRRRLDDPPTEITITLFTGYAAFLPAEQLHLSGVLAVVTAGLYLGWRGPGLASPPTRLQAFAVWEILTFLGGSTRPNVRRSWRSATQEASATTSCIASSGSSTSRNRAVRTDTRVPSTSALPTGWSRSLRERLLRPVPVPPRRHRRAYPCLPPRLLPRFLIRLPRPSPTGRVPRNRRLVCGGDDHAPCRWTTAHGSSRARVCGDGDRPDRWSPTNRGCSYCRACGDDVPFCSSLSGRSVLSYRNLH